MTKKLLILIITLIMCVGLISCSKNNFLNKEKPSLNYHTESLKEDLAKSKPKVRILDMNIYSETVVNEEDIRIVKDLTDSLKDDNFLKEEDIPKKPLYKFFIDVNSNKYVIDIYGDDFLTLYPWDSTLSKDFITLKDVPNAFKLEAFCQYAFDKKS
ncbi:DUF4883 family protein [Clostridium sp. B9]|uniref:DUF4883 family protein n=1 Tax=Clostridium sp. B9 TaxID=3423224 RepID=UPI003D2EA099